METMESLESQTANCNILELWNNGVKSIIYIPPIQVGTVASSLPVENVEHPLSMSHGSSLDDIPLDINTKETGSTLTTEDPLARKRRKAKERKQRWREKQTEESLKKIREADAASHRRRISLLNPEQLQAHRAANAAAQRRHIELLSPEQLEAHRAANAASQRRHIELLSPEQLQAHRAANAASQRRHIKLLSPEQLQAHRAANAASQRHYIQLQSNKALTKCQGLHPAIPISNKTPTQAGIVFVGNESEVQKESSSSDLNSVVTEEVCKDQEIFDENDSGRTNVDVEKESPSSFPTEEICKDQKMFFTDAVNTVNKDIEEGDILNQGQQDSTIEASSPGIAAMAVVVNQLELIKPELPNQMSRHQKRKEMLEKPSADKSSGSWVIQEQCLESNSSWYSGDSETVGKTNSTKNNQHISAINYDTIEDSGSSQSLLHTSSSSVISSSLAFSSCSTPLLLASSSISTASYEDKNFTRCHETGRRKAIPNKLKKSMNNSTNVILNEFVATSERLPEGHCKKLKINIWSLTKTIPPSHPCTKIFKECFVNLEKLNIKGRNFVVNLKEPYKMMCCEKPLERIRTKTSTSTSRNSNKECVVDRT